MRGCSLTMLLATLFAGAVCAQVAPNIVVFVADDMGIVDTSAYLNRTLGPTSAPITKTLRTPNLDRLATHGITFTDVHSASSKSGAGQN